MRTGSVKKYVIPNIPYLFVLWACLKLGTAYRLAAGAGDRRLALERVLRGDRHRGGHLRPAVAAVFARAGTARSVTRLTFCCRVAQN